VKSLRFSGFIIIALALFFGVLSVSADHTLTLINASCDASTNTLIVNSVLNDPNPLIQSSGIRVYVGGIQIATQVVSGRPNGQIVYVITDSRLTDFVNVSIKRYYNPGSGSVTAVCRTPRADSPDLPARHNDGRINNYDFANPIVVYPWQDETGDGFEIYTDEGDLLFRVNGADIAGTTLGEIIVSDSEHSIVVSRLADGTFQITALMDNGKTYVLLFSEPYSNIGYTSYEIE
jgi:hypothetical protein